MSGAQPKAGNIAGCVTVCAEVNPKITHIRHSQGWINEVIEDINELVPRVKKALENQEVVSIAYLGNVVDIWERFDQENLHIDLGSDQTSLHNPWAGGYYPVGISFEDANTLMAENPRIVPTKSSGNFTPPYDSHQQTHCKRHLFLRLRQCLFTRSFARRS